MKSRYYNLYGMESGEADTYDRGVAFRGGVLISVGADVAKLEERELAAESDRLSALEVVEYVGDTAGSSLMAE